MSNVADDPTKIDADPETIDPVTKQPKLRYKSVCKVPYDSTPQNRETNNQATHYLMVYKYNESRATGLLSHVSTPDKYLISDPNLSLDIENRISSMLISENPCTSFRTDINAYDNWGSLTDAQFRAQLPSGYSFNTVPPPNATN
eukprot:487680-Hanusia_phi.AAC.1